MDLTPDSVINTTTPPDDQQTPRQRAALAGEAPAHELLPAPGPVAAGERLATLDLLRGFAVLGILAPNIQVFSMPGSAYSNPTVWGDLTGINLLAWLLTNVLFDLKFISMFSMLFGAGILLMITRAEQRGHPRPLRLHLRRMGWLLLFGLAHAYLLWYGDILFTYAVCGVLFVLFRKWSPRRLVVCGLVLLSINIGLWLMMGATLPYWDEKDSREMMKSWEPSPARLKQEVAAYRGNWQQQMPERATWALFFQVGGLPYFTLWRVGGMMLLGMALLKSGFLTGAWQRRRYAQMALLGIPGLLLAATGAMLHMKNNWDFAYSQFQGQCWNLAGSVMMTLSFASLLILLWKSGRLQPLTERLQAVGRMAFSNYILQTLVCTTLFYGHGFGLYGYAERWQQLLVVLAVWSAILLLSPWWLARYGQGPLEKLWRRLTYGAARAT